MHSRSSHKVAKLLRKSPDTRQKVQANEALTQALSMMNKPPKLRDLLMM